MECGAMHFGEFNPLDVLATAASLQSSGRGEGEQEGQSDDGDGDTEEGGEDGGAGEPEPETVTSPHTSQPSTSPSPRDKPASTVAVTTSVKPSQSPTLDKPSFVSPNGTVKASTLTLQAVGKEPKSSMPRVVKVVNANVAGPSNKIVNGNGRPVVTLRDNTKVMVTSKDGTPKSLTVLRLNKGQNPDHSYAVYSKLDKPRFDEDEGYCSRSSLGSPGQCWKSDSETTEPDVFETKDTVDCDPKSPYLVLPGGSSVRGLDHSAPTIHTAHKAGQSSLRSPPSTSKAVLSPPLPPKLGVTILDCPPGGPTVETVTPSKVNGTNKKQTKIVIVSQDANLRKFFAHSKDTEEAKTKDTESAMVRCPDSCHGKDSVSNSKVENDVVDINKLTEDQPSEDVIELSPTTGVLSVISKSVKMSQKEMETNCKEHSCLENGDEMEEDRLDVGKMSPQKADDVPDTAVTSVNSCGEDPGPETDTEAAVATTTSPVSPQQIENSPKTETVLALIDSPPLSGATGGKKVIHVSKELSGGVSVTTENGDTSDGDKCPVMDTTDREVADTSTTETSQISVMDTDSTETVASQLPKNISAEDLLDIEPSESMNIDGSSHVEEEDEGRTTLDTGSKTPVILSDSECSDHCVSALTTDGSCGNANNGSREHTVIHSPTSMADVLTVVTPGEQKPSQTSHKMLQGLLAAGKAKGTEGMKATQTVLLPSGQICRLSTSFDGQPNLQPLIATGKPLLSSTAPTGVNKMGVVYLVSSNQPAGSVSLVDQSLTSKVASASSTPGSQYIIQDDLPPVAKYNPGSLSASQTKPVATSSVAKTNTTISSGSRLCAVQPKAIAPAKDSWVVLKPGVTSPTPTPQTTNLVAMSPGIRGIVPGGCTMLPLLVGASGTKPRSLLPIAAKVPLSSPVGKPVLMGLSLETKEPELLTSSAKSVLDKTNSLPPTSKKVVDSSSPVVATTSAAIPNMTIMPLDSSQVLSPSINNGSILPDDIFDTPTVSVIKPSVALGSGSLTASQPNTSDLKTDTPPVNPEESTDVCLSAPQSEPLEEGSEMSHISRCGTPITPASGRTTPAYEGRLTPLDLTSSSSDSSPSPSGGKINIKISGGVVVDVRQESGPRESVSKATRSIGQVGSLTWQGTLNSSRAVGMIKTAATSIQASRVKAAKMPKKETAALEMRRKQRAKLKAGNPSRAELFRMRESAQSMSELHPLIDHDYCTFTEFSADIQSSIIATTESKLKTERKYIKKTKAARTKTIEDSPTKCIVEIPKLKKRKYTKRKLGQLLQSTQKESLLSEPVTEPLEGEELTLSTINQLPMMALENKKLRDRDRKPKRRYRPRNSGDKNYVKIPGSYQDQFVYYATKKVRGKPRKYESELHGDLGFGFSSQGTKPTPVTNISEFEWYKEMARIDKGTKFGVTMSRSDTLKPPSSLPLLRNGSQSNPYNATKGITPIHESEVVDMVMDMMPSSGIPVNTAVDSNKILGALMHDADSQMSVSSLPGTSLASEGHLGATLAHSEDSSSSSLRTGMITETVETVPPPEEGTVDAGVMAEFHRLLNSMEESDQLKILENLNVDSRVEDKDESKAAVDMKGDRDGTLNNLNAYLGAYNSESQSSGAALSQAPGTSQFLDLDEINDSDLLNTELGNIGAIFGDLATSSSSSVNMASQGIMATSVLDSPTKMPSSHFSSFADTSCSDTYSIESSSMDMNSTVPGITASRENSASASGTLSAFGKPLDETELFPDISSPTVPSTADFGGVPELMLVNMYWNDLPGLLIHGQEYVRLVDIHKQVLPAKDTGILKKRCQMMGLDIRNCSELQRDFLIRYMNAAKSKSCVIVQKEAAKTLIGFYVDPRPRTVNKQTSEDVASPARPWRDDDASSVEMETANPEQADVAMSEEEAEAQKQGSSTGKNKMWTMHDHDKPKPVHNGLKVVSSTDSPKVVKIRIPKPNGRVLTKHPRAPPANAGSADSMATQHNHAEIDPKRSARLKNKKVQYAALHNGGWSGDGEGEEVEVESSRLSKVPRVEAPVKPPAVEGVQTVSVVNGDVAQKTVSNVNILPFKDSGEVKVIFAAPKSRKISSADEVELKKLITKQKKRKLNQKEKRRIRRLREKIRKQEARISQEDMKRLKERREKWLKNLEKAKQKRLLEKTQAAKYSREHCYAAYPNQQDKVVNGDASDVMEVTSSDKQDQVVHNDCGAVASDSPDQEAVALDTSSPLSDPVVSGCSGIQVVHISGSVEQSTPADNKIGLKKHPKVAPVDLADKSLPVIHRDTVQRGQRARTQDGTLYLDRYQTKEAACIQCNTCQERLSIRRFLKHRHPQNIPDELMEVSLPQRLELGLENYAGRPPPLADLARFAVFVQKRQQFAASPGMSQRRRARKKTVELEPNSSALGGNKYEKSVKLAHTSNTQSSHKEYKTEVRTPRPKNKLVRRSETIKEQASSLPIMDDEFSPGGSIRHSSRTRKKKQLHPMESYVFARRLSQGEPEVKKAKRGRRRGHAKSLG